MGRAEGLGSGRMEWAMAVGDSRSEGRRRRDNLASAAKRHGHEQEGFGVTDLTSLTLSDRIGTGEGVGRKKIGGR